MAQGNGHASQHHAPTVSWFELFYDLVVIAAVALSNDVFLEEPSLQDAIAATLAFTSLAWVWFLTTLVNNMHPSRDMVRRVIQVVQMALIVIAALMYNHTEEGRAHFAFLAYAGALLTVPLLMLTDRLRGKGTTQRRNPTLSSAPQLVAVLICVVGALIPRAWAPVALLAVLLASIVPVLTWQYPGWRDSPSLRTDHLRERLGLFILIVLGEGFAQLVSALKAMDTVPRTGLFAMTFLVSFGLWWVYFERTFHEAIDLRRVRWRLTLLGHFLLVLSMAGTLDILVLLTAQEEEEIGDLIMEYFSLCVAGVLLSFALLRLSANGRFGRAGILHVVSAVLVAGLGIALGDAGMKVFLLVVVVSAVAVIGNGMAAAWFDRREAAQPRSVPL